MAMHMIVRHMVEWPSLQLAELRGSFLATGGTQFLNAAVPRAELCEAWELTFAIVTLRESRVVQEGNLSMLLNGCHL